MRRLTEARKQIVQGYPIVTVAIDLGFADQSHLTRCFHQTFGLPPGRLQRLCGSFAQKTQNSYTFLNSKIFCVKLPHFTTQTREIYLVPAKCSPRKVRIKCAMVFPSSSNAKWPVSRRCNSALGKSRR
jgi:hypothetical protein